MALPPEQFHIKRRREEEPVETLYIQSELHQKKRRFTDFIFQRVQVVNDAVATVEDVTPATPSTPGQGRVRSPRSVSTSFFPKRASGSNVAGGIPTVRATSPGAEFREERALAAARRQQEEAKRKRLIEPIDSIQQQQQVSIEKKSLSSRHPSRSAQPSQNTSAENTTQLNTASPSSFPTSLRRFHISRPSRPVNLLKTATSSGIAKSSTSAHTRAILVEKLTQSPSLRGASILETLEKAENPAEIDTVVQSQLREEVVRPRKRPVVNQAEKKWREQQRDSISAAKEHLTTTTVESSDYLDKLAKDFEEVRLNIESEENQMDFTWIPPLESSTKTPTSPLKQSRTSLKYKPRHPSTRKSPAAETVETVTSPSVEPMAVEEKEEEMDDDYVYDTYIRVPVRPTPGMNGLTDPLADTNANAAMPPTPHDIDPTRKDIGIVVITEEDKDLWEDFLENDDEEEENWDGEDVDSNAEDNPANDYPDEELSSADEHDDPTAIYHRYRHTGSDEEEFDMNQFDEYEHASDDDNSNNNNTGYDDEDEKVLGRARRLRGLYSRQHHLEESSDDDDERY